MQSETDFLDHLDEDSQTKEAYRFFMKVDPDMRDFLGPIEEKEDKLTGRVMRQREAKIGMIRGASEENMKATTVYLDPFPHIRQPKGKDLQGWYSGKGDGKYAGSRERPCETDAILTQPYGGYCAVGCQFCYINSGTRGYRGSGLLTVPMGYGEHVRKQLASMQVSTAGYFSSFTDPFQPLEDWYHNTQNGAQAFVDAGLPVFFLSRLHYPGWAFDILKQNKYSYAQKSINTSNPDTWHRLSPGAIPLEDMLSECKALHDAGIYVSIQCNPIVPGVVDHDDIENLFELFAKNKVDHVIVKFVEAGHSWARAMVERITKQFPDARSTRFKELFIENQCGGQRTIVESYRREAHERYRAKATKLGMTYSLCYEYTNKTGTWKSMGPEFLTSAGSCHGQTVPMFRKVANHFEAMDECPPSGCLRCADDHGGANLCGSEILVSAPALKLKDLRHPWDKPKSSIIPLRSI